MFHMQNSERSFGSKLLINENLKHHKQVIDKSNASNPVKLKNQLQFNLRQKISNLRLNKMKINFQRTNVMECTNQNLNNSTGIPQKMNSFRSSKSKKSPKSNRKNKEWNNWFNNTTENNRAQHKDLRGYFEPNLKNKKIEKYDSRKISNQKSVKGIGMNQNKLSGFGKKYYIDRQLSKSFTEIKPIFDLPFYRNIEKCFESDQFKTLNQSFDEGFKHFNKKDLDDQAMHVYKEKKVEQMTYKKAVKKITNKQKPETFDMSYKLKKFKEMSQNFEKNQNNKQMYNVYKRVNDIYKN